MRVTAAERQRLLGVVIFAELEMSFGDVCMACAGGRTLELKLSPDQWAALSELDDGSNPRPRRLVARVGLVEIGEAVAAEAPSAGAAPLVPVLGLAGAS